MKNKLVKILSVVSIVCLFVGCFAFSSSASFEPEGESIDFSPSYYSNTNARSGYANYYYISDNLKDYSGFVDLEFVSNGIKFSRITSGDGDIYFSNSHLSLQICNNGAYLEGDSWRYVLIYPVGTNNVNYVKQYFDTTGLVSRSWQNSLQFTFVNFSTFKNSYYLSTMVELAGTGSRNYACNVRVSLNGSSIEARSFNQVVIRGAQSSVNPSCMEFRNTSNGDSLALPLFEETSSLNWNNLFLYAMPASATGFYFIDLLTLISEQAIGDFPYSLYDDRELNEQWEYFNFCDVDFSSFKPLIGSFYSCYGLPDDASALRSDSGLCINSRGILCSDNFPNDASTPWFDTFTIISDGDYLVCSSSFYWLFDYLAMDVKYNDKSMNSGDSFTFISTSAPSNLDMFYNSFGLYYGYCGFVIDGVLYKYFDYSSYDDELRFYIDVDSTTGSPEVPDFVISVSDFKLHTCTLPVNDYVGDGFYQFVVLNMSRVGADISADIQNAYEEGKRVGYSDGLRYAETQYSKYENLGYNKGFEAAKDIYDSDSGGIIGKLLSAPGDAFDSLVLYESNGITVSLWDVFTTLLCASLFIWFLKMFAGG